VRPLQAERLRIDAEAGGRLRSRDTSCRQGSVETIQALASIFKMAIRIIQWAAVMGTQNKKPHHFRIEFFQDLANREKVAQGFGHLFIINPNKPVVHPDIDKGLVGLCLKRTLGLGDLIFVMRKLQIGPATMDIKMLPEQCATHRRALDMPARPALTPGRRPFHLAWLVGLCPLPKHKIQRITLTIAHRHPLACAQFIQ